ncbi:MAG: hypothetical protein RQ856_05835 [Candidatus Izemoplasmatales bacterium]|nr:hypothetical protein [Candidatus Izemoplasmatales bacterium]
MVTIIAGKDAATKAEVTNPVPIQFSNGTTEVYDGIVCTKNTTSTPLGIDAVFEGTSGDILDYGVLFVGIYSDVPSATDGLEIYFSPNGTDWYVTDKYTYIDNGVTKIYSFSPVFRYYKVKYTNSGVAQTEFHLQTILKKNGIKSSSHRIQDNIVDEDDAELVKSVLTGEDDNGMFQNVKTDLGGLLRVNSFNYLYGIAEGDILGHTALLKFGTRTSVAANTPSIIWEGTNANYTYLTSAEQLQVTSSSAQDGVGGTGFLTMTLIGLDANFLEITETVTMNGLTQVTTTNSFIRIYRAYGATSGTSLTNVGNITITNNAGTNQLVYIPAGDGQTLMTMWTVPAGKVAYLLSGSFSSDTSKGARVTFRTRLNDGGTLYPWLTKYRAYVTGGNNQFPFQIPFKIPAKTDIEVRVLTPVATGNSTAGATFELWYEDV